MCCFFRGQCKHCVPFTNKWLDKKLYYTFIYECIVYFLVAVIETKCFIFISQAIFYAIPTKDIDKQRKQEVEQMALCRKAFVFFDLSVASCYLFNSFNSCAWLLVFSSLLVFPRKIVLYLMDQHIYLRRLNHSMLLVFLRKMSDTIQKPRATIPDYVTPTSQNLKLFLNIYVKNGRDEQQLKFNLIAFVKV